MPNPSDNFPVPDIFVEPILPIRTIRLRPLSPESKKRYQKAFDRAVQEIANEDTMSTPETDADYRERIKKVCSQEDRDTLHNKYGTALDTVGRKYDRYRYGKTLIDEPKKD